jgi:hypothetical protein
MENHVDFVEGKPIFDQTLIAGKECATKFFIEV